MDIARFIIFFSILIAIFSFLEIYTLFNWKKYVQRHKLNKKFYSIPKVISIITILIAGLAMLGGLFIPISNSIRFVLMFLIAIWVLPKLAIIPVLLIKDICRLVLFVQKKILKKPAISSQQPDEKKRKMIETAAWSLASIPYIMVGKGLVSTTYDFTRRKAEISLPNLPKSLDGLRIVQISDLHLGSFFDYKPFQEVVRIVNSLKPDLLFITGDFVNSDPNELKSNYRDIKQLRADIGLYSCLGNHDHYMNAHNHNILVKSLYDLGTNLLINRNKQLTINNAPLNIIGVDNVGMRQNYGDFSLAFKGVTTEHINILLCHDPTNWDKNIRNKYPADLTLSGHTHGGQVAWKFDGLDFEPARFVYKQVAGLYKNGGYQLYVNRGIGTVGPPLRIGVPPEITEITLKA
jgi:predicted MPP superfamily phosphohydrolase